MNLPIIYRRSRRIYRLAVPQRRTSARPGRTKSSAESTDLSAVALAKAGNRLMFRKIRPMPVAKLASQNVSPIYHQTAIIYHLGLSSEELAYRESSSNRQTEIANRQPIGKRLSLIGKQAVGGNLKVRMRIDNSQQRLGYPQPIRSRPHGYPQSEPRQAVLRPATKWVRVPTIEWTGELQQAPPEMVERDAGKVPTVSAQLEVTND